MTGPLDPFETDERKALRASARGFAEREIQPDLDAWELDGVIPAELAKKAAGAGLLGVGYPEAVGGEGGSVIDAMVLAEGLMAGGASTGSLAALLTHNVSLPHMVRVGTPDQVARFVKPALAGEKVGSLGVTEADVGSDLAATRTTARRDGDHYVVNGAKMFITSGARADFVTTLVRTGGPGPKGLSILVVESGTPGFSVSRKLNKMGWLCSDTAELAFTDCRVPAANLVGREGDGFGLLMHQLMSERLMLAIQACAIAQRSLDLTVDHVRSRVTFGQPLISRQVVQHKLVEMHQRIDVARTYARAVTARFAGGEQVTAETCLAKIAAADACSFVVDQAAQLHGSMGFMRETEIERHYRDARVFRIGGGASEPLADWAARMLGYHE
ncbi:acyl-CoA dehydrogenase family protein [[Mycobacterium] nativiensis]|uniref:Acyl-CoA dehydrogenase family protein n=1 Tax=[Mycobacterium] nativiensis TaxID=2855503 RepID=A0ABU5XXV1_9MYCO|nr:acyl-CoA dehydrogenase family protein [Mycolicibacter sp. MYC340]MEB3031841.1 acyl-CoA dehydrogenase family protein [Mycolicibacter sp. MYC340]